MVMTVLFALPASFSLLRLVINDLGQYYQQLELPDSPSTQRAPYSPECGVCTEVVKSQYLQALEVDEACQCVTFLRRSARRGERYGPSDPLTEFPYLNLKGVIDVERWRSRTKCPIATSQHHRPMMILLTNKHILHRSKTVSKRAMAI
ncbi:hypothetical protein F5146DRAFT_640755 [Armillaria mellea]|nr:hypothetical protein F5146DRAFT_640755 [Armillaria mellea]